MSFRGKLILFFALTIVLTVGAVTGLVIASTSRAYARIDEERSQSLAAEFRNEFARQQHEISQQAHQLATSDAAQQLAVQLARSAPDYSRFVDATKSLGGDNFQILDLLDGDGKIISSREWPARFGYKSEWFASSQAGSGASLQTVDTANGSALAIVALERVSAGDQNYYIASGRSLDSAFLQSVELPEGMTALLFQPNATRGGSLLGSSSAEAQGAQERSTLVALAERTAGSGAAQSETVADDGAPGMVRAIPLLDPHQNVAAVLLVVSSQKQLADLLRRIRMLAAAVAAGGILLGILLSTLAAARITRPVESLALAADEVAAGNLRAYVDDSSADELGRLAYAFNRMTRELLAQREKLLQSERVAAWRELARRLAHELKNPLFPLQITVENLLKAWEQQPAQFEEVFRESATTLLGEIENLKNIIARFSDFSKMPAPEPQIVSLNDAARRALRLYEPQLAAEKTRAIRVNREFEPALDAPNMRADPELLHRALSNLVLNAIDAMPKGGTLTLQTTKCDDGKVRIAIGDTGEGITEEERIRLFTPYYTSKQHGTGLGLAIVQAVVSDHKGRIWVLSAPGKGSTFWIELPRGM